MSDSSNNNDDEPSEVTKPAYSNLLLLFHELNRGYERLKQRYNKLELEIKKFN